MSIPLIPITVKMPPDDIPHLDKQSQARGFEGRSDYVRHLIAQDRELLHKQWLALDPIFGAGCANSKTPVVVPGNIENSQ